jgi:hypothetical protein
LLNPGLLRRWAFTASAERSALVIVKPRLDGGRVLLAQRAALGPVGRNNLRWAAVGRVRQDLSGGVVDHVRDGLKGSKSPRAPAQTWLGMIMPRVVTPALPDLGPTQRLAGGAGPVIGVEGRRIARAATRSGVLRRTNSKPRRDWADRALFSALCRHLPRGVQAVGLRNLGSAGRDDRRVIFSVVYAVARAVLGLVVLRGRRAAVKDVAAGVTA